MAKFKSIFAKLIAKFVSIIFLSFIIISSSLFLTNEPISATTYDPPMIIVSQNGTGDYRSIQAAIDNASKGDSIIVKPGEYYENITINKSINLIGSGVENTYIIGYQTGAVLTINSNWTNISKLTVSGYYSYSLLFIRGNHNTISDSLFYGSVIGIDLKDAHYNLIDNCTCLYNSGAGIYLGGSSWNTITETDCLNCTYGNGIYLFYGYRNTFQNGTSSGNADDGLYAYWLSDFNIIENYKFNNNSGSGVQLFDSDYFTIRNSESLNNGVNGFIISSTGNIIENCISNSNSGDGFYLYHSDASTISNSSSCLNQRRGFYVKYSSENIIKNNMIVSNDELGINLGLNSKTNKVYSNDLINNNKGIIQASDSGSNNNWHVSDAGNFWWDYSYFYPSASHDGKVWNRSYEISTGNEATDNHPLIKPINSYGTIDQIFPGILNDFDSDGIFDLIDKFPLNNSEWLDTDDDGTGDNTDLDDDNDGLSDHEEIIKGTDPKLNDTDSDNFLDNIDEFPNDGDKWT
jgi:parallel beta-helix repeat protein